MDDIAIDEQAVWLIRSMARRLTQPRAGECLVCYVARMLDEFGCDTTLRFARNYRDQVAPRATQVWNGAWATWAASVTARSSSTGCGWLHICGPTTRTAKRSRGRDGRRARGCGRARPRRALTGYAAGAISTENVEPVSCRRLSASGRIEHKFDPIVMLRDRPGPSGPLLTGALHRHVRTSPTGPSSVCRRCAVSSTLDRPPCIRCSRVPRRSGRR